MECVLGEVMGGGTGWGKAAGEEWMESSREVLVLPVIFIKQAG